MRSNRRIADLAMAACVDSYYQYGVIATGHETYARAQTLDIDNSQVTVYQGDKINILAFRGTDDPQDWMENFDLWPAKAHRAHAYEAMRPFVPAQEAKVHGGFYKTYKRLQPPLRTIVDDLDDPDARWLLTGHSMGGAVACIAAMAMRWGHDPDVVTFGAPRWGNQHACWIANQKTRSMLRFVNNNDLVPTLPSPVGPWRHCSPAIQLHGDERNPFSAHLVFDYRVGLVRYTG